MVASQAFDLVKHWHSEPVGSYRWEEYIKAKIALNDALVKKGIDLRYVKHHKELNLGDY